MRPWILLTWFYSYYVFEFLLGVETSRFLSMDAFQSGCCSHVGSCFFLPFIPAFCLSLHVCVCVCICVCVCLHHWLRICLEKTYFLTTQQDRQSGILHRNESQCRETSSSQSSLSPHPPSLLCHFVKSHYPNENRSGKAVTEQRYGWAMCQKLSD